MVYVISDLHGYPLGRLKALLEQAEFGADDFLYVLGDVIDRGSDGISLLRWLMLQPNAELILGNHEDMMLKNEFLLDEVCDESADDDPWFEAAPARLRLIDQVADERIDEELEDTEHEDDRRDDADHILVMTRVAGVEEVARDENHEIRREHRVKHIMAERAACVSDARPNLSPAV